MVVNAFYPSAQEAEADGFVWVQGQSGLHSKTKFYFFFHFYLCVYTPPSVRAGVHRDQRSPIPPDLELQVVVSPLT